MRERLRQIWEMRNDSSGVVRIGWWGTFAVLLALLISPVPGGELLRGLWSLWNLGLLTVTVVTALVRTRGILRGGAAAFRWAFWGSLIAFLTLLIAASRYLGEWATRLSLPATMTSLGLFLALVGAPIAFVGLFVIGLFGAAFGVVRARDRSEQAAAAGAGVSRLWIGALLVVLVMALGRALRLPESTLWAVPMGLPSLVALMGAGAGSKRALPWDVGGELGRFLMRWFVRRVQVGQRVLFVDLRGPVLGIVAGLMALALNTLTALEPLQSAELLQMERMVSATALSGGEKEEASSDIGFVLMRLDEMTRRKIAEGSSETAVQAGMIRRLTQLGALRIVLPSPAVTPPDPTVEMINFGIVAEPDQPPIDEGAVKRARRDLPDLVRAVRASGRVLLGTVGGRSLLDLNLPDPSDPERKNEPKPPPEVLQRARRAQAARRPPPALRAAVAGAGIVDLEAFGTPQLPLIPLDSAPLSSLPVELFNAVEESRGREVESRSRELRQVRTIQPNRVLVNFPDARVGMAFPTLDYVTVLSGGKVYQRRNAPDGSMKLDQGEWLPLTTYFKNKIVFLDSLQPSYRESPLGLMPHTELLAHATRTLLRGSSFGAVHPEWQILLTLLLPALVGYLGAGRDPFGAGWRLALVAGILATSSAVIAFSQVWLDPVAPLVGCVGAYLLVTQLTWHTNESDRDLLRRFAAPQVVEELLRRPEMLALGGSRQKLCVLFADVRGFTTFTEQHRDEPERVIETINAYSSAMTEALFQFHGVLDKYTGDGLMAFFPLEEREDDRACVERSVRAALAMRDATDVVTAQLREADLQPLHVGIGMHFGEAVVGLVGNLNQFNYTALGYTVVVAARLQTLAKGGEVIVSTEIDTMIRRAFETEALPPVEVKGVSEPVTPYRVLRPRIIPLEGEDLSQLAAGSVHGEP